MPFAADRRIDATMTVRSTLTALLALGACACGASSPDPTPAAPSDPAPIEPAPVEPAPAATSTTSATATSPTGAYEVHEWGVIDVQEDGTAEIAAGAGRPPPPAPARPPMPDRPMPTRKPVLYFHLASGTDALTVDVRARLMGGTVYETYPMDSRPSPDVAQWTASLSPGPCTTVPPGASPVGASRDITARRPVRRCPAPDGICEVLELPRYDATTASCVEVNGVRAGMLFYRGTSRPTLPLAVSRADDMAVTVTAAGSTIGMPGAVLRVSTNLSGPWPMGHVVISRADVPSAGASVTLPVGTVAVDRTATSAELGESLRALGLDEAETTAFLAAWMEAFFGPEVGAPSDGSPAVPQDSVIYFLPESGTDALTTLELSPAPSRVRRAFMVRVILPGVATA